MATVTQYRYLFADLLTNQIIAELPLTGVNFTQQLNTAGTLQGHLLLSGVNAYGLNVNASTIPARTAIYVDRNGSLVWGGIIWSRSYNSATQTLSITAREFESYFERRRITSTISYTNLDQATIAQSLLSLAQGVPSGNIGLIIGNETTGVTLSRTYYNYELKTYFAAIQDLSRALNGFDFNVVVAYDNDGNPTKTFKIGYPRIGTAYGLNDTGIPMFELGSNIVEYDFPEDGSITANSVYALGAGSNEGKLISNAQDASKLSSGWPLLEEQANYSDVTDATYLSSLSNGLVQNVSYPPTTIKVVAPPYLDPVFGSYQIGDNARIRITDDRFPTSLDTLYRIVAFNVTPGENGPEQVTVTLTSTTN
jgi:hypothetical protein